MSVPLPETNTSKRSVTTKTVKTELFHRSQEKGVKQLPFAPAWRSLVNWVWLKNWLWMQNKFLGGSQEYVFKNHAANKLQEGSADKVYILPMRTNITKILSHHRVEKKKTFVSGGSLANKILSSSPMLSADLFRNALNDLKRPMTFKIDSGILISHKSSEIQSNYDSKTSFTNQPKQQNVAEGIKIIR